MAGFRRFFVSKVESETIIEGEEFRHAVSVLRIKEGENIIDSYSKEDIAFIFNCINCEAHQEILHTALKDKLR